MREIEVSKLTWEFIVIGKRSAIIRACIWEISGESYLPGQVIAFGLGTGICFCIKSTAWHVTMW